MKATNAYVAKRALIDRLTALTATGQPLDGIQVQYARDDRRMETQCVYGGGARFAQTQETAEPGVRYETVTTGLYVRILGKGLDVRPAEQLAEATADAIADSLAANTELAGGLTFEQIVGGSADFYPLDDGVEVILSLSVAIESHLV